MWYHSLKAIGPANDAPMQLTEATFRGTYLQTLPTAFLIPASEDGTNFVNYDVSYVDAMMLPVAMEASNVEVPYNNNDNGNGAPYGWIGSSLQVSQMQAAMQSFTKAGSADLGSYFDGAGYPRYFDPNPSDINVPSGQNLLGQSPYLGTPSSYPFLYTSNAQVFNLGFQYMLTSAGPGPIYLIAGSNNQNLSHENYLLFNPDPRYLAILSTIKAGLGQGQEFDVTSSGNDLPAGVVTKVTNVELGPIVNGVQTWKVDLDQTTVGTPNPDGNVYTFTRAIKDTPATSLMNLWYAWANYYVTTGYLMANPNAAAQTNLQGTTAANMLTLSDPVTTLVPGMLVTGPNLSAAAGCTILKIAADHKTITLSQVAAGSGEYSFALPTLAAIAGSSDKIVNPLADKLSFARDDSTANVFSQVVYEVMSAMSTIPRTDSNFPASVQMMFNVIGCSTGQLKNINTAIDVMITNDVKSLLRGVPDFNTAPYNSPTTWYPDPSVATGDLTFNAYNLDPFVWFVHEKLGLSGYGFSVDDDTSDVGAPGATRIQMSIGGLKGLQNQNEWTLVTPFGPVKGEQGVVGPTGNTIQFTDVPNSPRALMVYARVLGAGGAQVNGVGVPPNTKVVSVTLSDIKNKEVCTVTVNTHLTPGATGTYYFFGPVVATGTVVKGGDTITKLSEAAFNTLQEIGPIDTHNILVNGPGIQAGTTVKEVKDINGVYTVVLSEPLGAPLKNSPTSLGYTFSTT